MSAAAASVSGSFWSPLDVASSASVKPSFCMVEKASQASVVDRSHNVRHARFAALRDALKSVTKLDEDDSFYLTPEVSARATDFLSVISANLKIDPPKFLPQDGEVAVFTWETALAKRFLSIDLDELDLLDVNKSTFVKCAHSVPPGVDEWTFFINELGASLNASNSNMNAYA